MPIEPIRVFARAINTMPSIRYLFGVSGVSATMALIFFMQGTTKSGLIVICYLMAGVLAYASILLMLSRHKFSKIVGLMLLCIVVLSVSSFIVAMALGYVQKYLSTLSGILYFAPIVIAFVLVLLRNIGSIESESLEIKSDHSTWKFDRWSNDMLIKTLNTTDVRAGNLGIEKSISGDKAQKYEEIDGNIMAVNAKAEVFIQGSGDKRIVDAKPQLERTIDAHFLAAVFAPGQIASLTVTLRLPNNPTFGQFKGVALVSQDDEPVNIHLESKGFTVISEPPPSLTFLLIGTVHRQPSNFESKTPQIVGCMLSLCSLAVLPASS